MESPRSILVFRNGSIGNTLVAVPAMRALRHRYPEVPMTVVVDSVGEELLRHCPWIQQLIRYDKRSADRGLIAHVRLIKQLRAARPTHAVLFKRFFRNGLLAYLSGARIRAGFETSGRAPFLTLTTTYEEGVSVVELDLRLAALLDAKPAGRKLEIWLSKDDRQAAEALRRNSNVTSPYIVAHYGGRTTDPHFFPEARFANTVEACAESLPIFMIAHGATEEASAERIAELLPTARVVRNLPVRTVAALIRGAKFFIGFNSGPAHLCAAVGTAGIVMFRPQPDVSKEISKWTPPSDVMRPLVPPTDDQDASWEQFTLHCVRCAQELQTPTDDARE